MCSRKIFNTDLFPIEEDNSIKNLKSFCREKLKSYKNLKNYLNLKLSSFLSRYLSIEVLSPK